MFYDVHEGSLPEIIRKRLPESPFARHLHCLQAIGSTNAYAKELAKKGAAEGSLVLSEEQTGGMGRMGRQWHSPSGVNLYASFVLRPLFSVERVFSLTMLTALALVQGIEAVAGIKTLIKWPNDIYFKHKKAAGILTEFSAKGKRIEHVIIGIGLNVNWDMKDRPDLKQAATSLALETGRSISRTDLLVSVFGFLGKHYGPLVKGEDGFVYKRWNELSMVIGKEVFIDLSNERKRAWVKGVDRNGALMIMDKQGKESSIVCGDVAVSFPSLSSSRAVSVSPEP